jgi:predicted permease
MTPLPGAIRHAARQLWTSRAFTATAVLTLALGIGGTTAIFTLIDAVMLRPLPVADPARLYRIGDGADSTAEGRPPGRWGMLSFPLYERLRSSAPEFDSVTAFDWGGTQLSVRRQGAADSGKSLRSEYATGSYFSTFGVGATVGRLFVPDDDQPSASPVLVLSHRAWRQAYGADPTIVGATLLVEGHPFTVTGVAAAEFFGETVRADPPDMWIPLQQEPLLASNGSLLRQSVSPWLFAVGRLGRGQSVEGIAPRLTGVLRQWIRDDAGYPGTWMPDILRGLDRQIVPVVPAGDGIGLEGLSAKEQYGSSLQVLFVVCGFVLLVACANVANLVLARAAVRRAQTAVRIAIGATRSQIVIEALTESVILAIAGSVVGLFVAVATARLLIALAFRNSQFVPIAATPSAAVLGFAAGLALLTGIVFGATPAWFATRTDPVDALRGSGRGSTDRSSRARAALMSAQMTMGVVLVAGSAMLARSLGNLAHQDFGFQVSGRVLIGLSRLPSTYTPERLSALYRELQGRLAGVQGVQSASLALYNPLGPSGWGASILVAGRPPNPGTETAAYWNRVSAGYLSQLGVSLARGRLFTTADDDSAAPVAIVNEAFVRRFLRRSDDPIDQHFGLERLENANTFRIVGVVRDAKFAGPGLHGAARPMYFVPLAQSVDYGSDRLRLVEGLSHFIRGILLVTDAPLGDLEPRIRRTLAEADPNLTITSVRTMRQQIDSSLDRERAVASLAGLFSTIVLVLAAVGAYSVTAYLVAQQTKEIGIRMALGADRSSVVGLVLGRTLQRAAVGIAAGLPLAVAAARLMSAQLYAVSFWDPVALTLAAGSVAGCVFVAAIVPAAGAAAISPMSALRSE